MNFPDFTPMLWGWAAAAALQLALWLLQLRTRNAGVVDLGWTMSLGILGVLYAIAYDGDPLRRIVIGASTGLWSLRLSWHLATDRILGKPEEGRYVHLREIWGRHADAQFAWFFQAQAALSVFLALPFAYAASSGRAFGNAWDIASLILLAIGLVGVTTADRQLAAFKRDPSSRGRTCRSGLWKYSRHPNYFFEWLVWCGFATLGSSAEGGLLGWSSPALLLFLILRVTGIPPTEAQALRSRGDDYRHYQRTTSPFFPWPPREIPR